MNCIPIAIKTDLYRQQHQLGPPAPQSHSSYNPLPPTHPSGVPSPPQSGRACAEQGLVFGEGEVQVVVTCQDTPPPPLSRNPALDTHTAITTLQHYCQHEDKYRQETGLQN